MPVGVAYGVCVADAEVESAAGEEIERQRTGAEFIGAASHGHGHAAHHDILAEYNKEYYKCDN